VKPAIMASSRVLCYFLLFGLFHFLSNTNSQHKASSDNGPHLFCISLCLAQRCGVMRLCVSDINKCQETETHITENCCSSLEWSKKTRASEILMAEKIVLKRSECVVKNEPVFRTCDVRCELLNGWGCNCCPIALSFTE
jgi:hypothetical protein